MDEKTREKLRLFNHAEKLIYCKDYQSIDHHRKHHHGNISWSQKLDAAYKIKRLKKAGDHIALELLRDEQKFEFDLQFQDEASLENIMHCIVMALELGMSPSEIQEGIGHLHNLSMRLEQKEGLNGCILINDSYSLDLKSLQLALQFVDQQNQNLPRTLVITDFAEHRDHSELFSGLEYLIDKYHIQKVILIGEEISTLQFNNKRNLSFHPFRNTEDVLEKLDDLNFHNELILIKGARKFKLERLFHQLSLSKHDTLLEIDLKAIAHNLDVYRSLLKPGTQIMAIVKAAAYGSGHYEIAKLLEHKKS
ncbi:MAG: alanine racemase [Saprospiraceae bacterium]|nr:alanine racemase [Saprospiraceae bacterium]